MSKFNKLNIQTTSSKHYSTHSWKIEITHALESAKWTNTRSWGFNYSQKDVYPKIHRYTM